MNGHLHDRRGPTPGSFAGSRRTLIDRGDEELEFKPTRQKIHEAIVESTSAWIQNGTLGQRVAADFAPGLIDLGPGVEVEVISTAGRVFSELTGLRAWDGGGGVGVGLEGRLVAGSDRVEFRVPA